MRTKHNKHTYYKLNGYKVRIEFDRYIYNDSLAVKLVTEDEELYAVMSVNIDESDLIRRGSCFIDTNNCPWAEKFIEDNNLGVFTGYIGQSGFCTYPCYDFSNLLKSNNS